MAEVFKTFAISLDAKVASYAKIPVVEGDTGNRFVITLTDDGTAVDLSTSRVVAMFSGAMGTAMQDSWTSADGLLVISGASHNIVTFDLLNGSYANGLNTCELQVYSGATYTRLVTSASFTFNARKPILNDTTIASTTEYPILVSLIDQVEALTDREQADWDETDDTKGTFINNKPVIGTDIQAPTDTLTAETTLSDTDTVPFYDASATAHRKSTWANIVATITALFRSIFMPYDATSTNLLINGGFDVWQRGTSFTATGYTADRWKMTIGTSQEITATRQAFTVGQADVPKNPAYYAQLAISNAGSANGAFEQRIENVSTCAGESIAYSFYAKCDATTYAAQVQMVQNFGSGGSTEVTLTAQNKTLTASWQKFEGTFALASVSGKTIGANNYLSFKFVCPTASGTKTISIANVQLNYGTVALPFVTRIYADELRMCMRYCHIISPGIWHTCASSTTTTVSGSIFLPVRMRIAPTCVFAATSTLSVYLATSAITTTNVTFSLVGSSTGLFITVTPTLTDGSVTQYRAGAMAFNQNIICDAEL